MMNWLGVAKDEHFPFDSTHYFASRFQRGRQAKTSQLFGTKISTK
jgi:hypothetical protein